MNAVKSVNNISLVSTSWLEEHLGDPNVRVIEVSFANDDAPYREGHVPGAVWWYWKDALWHETDRELAAPEEMAERLGPIGVTPQTTLILYGAPVQFGTYAFWVLTMCGHPDVRVLDGGRTAWLAEKRPLSKDSTAPTPAQYPPPKGVPFSRVGRDDVRAKLGQPGRILLDTRSPEEFRGERVMPPPNFDHGAERVGRIPGAVHLFFREFVNEDDTFKSPEELQAIFEASGVKPGNAGEIVTYCRLSHRATLVWFAVRYLLGHENVRVYDGSWTEWGSIVGFPIEK